MKHLRKAARDLRAKETSAEALLWSRMRNRQLGGLKFRRQEPVEKYIADFYCHEQRLVIEVDGEVHDQPYQCDADGNRDLSLRDLGYQVLRFRNREVFEELESVLERIRGTALTPQPPLPEGEGE